MPAEKTPSKASEARRSNKPLMEKRRRARINHSLTELKALILSAVKKDNSKHSKLEKADILEMTVKYLQNLQRQRVAANAHADSSAANKFRTGYGECTGEVSRFLGRRQDGVEVETRARLIDRSSGCADGLDGASQTPAFARDRAPATNADAGIAAFRDNFIPTVGGVKLIPARLTNGELAFILPTTTETAQKPPANAVLIKTHVWRPW